MNKFKLLSIALVASVIVAIITAFVLLVYYDSQPYVIGLVAFGTILIDICFGIYIMNSKRHIYTKAC
jgi:hypothetical protein